MGGLAVVISAGVVLGSAFLGLSSFPRWASSNLCKGIALGLLPILVVSLWDDIRPLRATTRLAAQTLGAGIAVWYGVVLAPTTHLFGQSVALGPFAILISVLWLIGVTNAFNIVDGLDGLSAGLALISAGSLTAVFLLSGQTGMARASLVLAGGLIGFLPYNLYPAKIFLGDTGSMAIGFSLACFALSGGATLSAGFATLLPVFVLGLPVAETLISIARRIVRRLETGTSGVLEADRDHIHHRLLALGITHRRAVFILYGVGLSLGLAGLVSVLMSARDAGLLLVALLVAGFVGVARLGYDEFAVIRKGLVLRFYETPVLKTSLFVVFVDIVIVALSVYGAIGLKQDDWGLTTNRHTVLTMTALLAGVTVATFWAVGLYRGSWRLASIQDFVRASWAVAAAATAGLLLTQTLTQLLPPSRVPVSVFAIYALLHLALTNGSRVSYRLLVLQKWRAANEGEPVLIYGAGQGGASALRELQSNAETGMRPVGFIDDDPQKTGRVVNGLPVLGTLEALDFAAQRLSARTVIVSTKKISEERLALARELCGLMGIELLRLQISFDRCTEPPRAGRELLVRHQDPSSFTARRSTPPPTKREAVSG
jgi:UDP-GlcNAc:undecaprenyl-phosphate GlcNAc-1-phosphate transferase